MEGLAWSWNCVPETNSTPCFARFYKEGKRL
jgi:hypothetical protein